MMQDIPLIIFELLALLLIIYILFFREYILARKKFICLRCNTCCKLKVYPSKSEMNTIRKAGFSDFMGKSGSIQSNENGECIFLGKKGKITYCKIQDLKPNTCKNFPFKKGLFGKMIDLRCKTCIGRLV